MQNSNNKISNYHHDLKVNASIVRLENDVLRIIDQDGTFDVDTIHNFKTGNIQYGLYQRDHIPFILIAIGDLKYDFLIDAFDLLPGKEQWLLNHYSGSVCFTIVSFKKLQFVVERRFRFSYHFTRHLKACLQKQLKYYHSEFEVRKRIDEVTRYVVTKEMFESSKLYQVTA